MKETPNDIPLNENNTSLNYIKKYTPFKFNSKKSLREKIKENQKYYGFIICDNSNKDKSINKNGKNNSKEIEENSIEDEKKENNDKENNIKIGNINKNEANSNTSYNSNNINIPFANNLDRLIDIVKEDDENECIESEESQHYVSHSNSYSGDDFGLGPDFTIRQDNALKILVVDIIETYNTLNPNYKYQIIKEDEGKIALTEPSEGVNNNGKDNKYDDLIVYKEDEIKNKEKNTTYIVKSLLGTGVSGQAFKAFCPNDNNYYALKIFKKSENLSKNCLFETRIMEILNNNDKNDQYHIIRLYDYFIFNNHFCIVIELLHKTLYQLLEMNNLEGISLNSIRYILKQILKSVEFIHSLKIVHTDLKPENILLSINKGDNNLNGNSNLNLSKLNNQNNTLNQINNNTSGINNMSNISLINKRVNIKIADFGNACLLSKLNSKIYVQSLYYRAPEAILHNRDKNEKIDIWSIGCILGELYLGNPIMPGNSSYDQLYKIHSLIGEIPQYMIEESVRKNIYFTKTEDNYTYNYRIKSPEEFYKEYPDVPKSEYEIPKNLKNIDDLINVKRDIIKSKNSLHKSMHNSSLSLNSTNTKEDLVAFIHLMKGMLQIDPRKRWSCKQCLKHPFLTKEKLDKFISSQLNEINQFMSNSFSNNSYNYQNNNCHSMNVNYSFNKFQGNNINKNNIFYGGKITNNKNNYSFGNFNNNNFNRMPLIYQQNSNINNKSIYQKNNNNVNNNFQQTNNYNNQKMNSSFSYNNNCINTMYINNPYQFNYIRFVPPNFLPYQNNAYNNPYNNQNMMNKNFPNYINYNNQNKKHNNTYMGTHTEKLNTSYNSNISKNSKKKNKYFKKNNPKEFLFNKDNILGNLEDNKEEEKPQDKINNKSQNEANISISKENINNGNQSNNLNNKNNIDKNHEIGNFETKNKLVKYN